MKDYLHQGIVKDNGEVDPDRTITDLSELKVLPSDDRFHLTGSQIGYFEWWYFDIIDSNTGCVLKIVAHFGTDPLRRKKFPQVAVTIKTPDKCGSIIKSYSLSDLRASSDFCDVSLKDEFHASIESPAESGIYNLNVNIDSFKAKFTFIRQIDGWKPLGDEIKVKQGNKRGAFGWVIPVPKAIVVGGFSFENKQYELKEALGYHDHNYWDVGHDNKLYMDDIVSHWYWGRFLSSDHAIIFMATYLNGKPIRSLMIARGNEIIHSSNNLIEVSGHDLKKDNRLKTFYPSKVTVSSLSENNPFKMTLKSKEVIDKRDLLEGVPSILSWFIKLLISKPSYYGFLADTSIQFDREEIRGLSLYEVMSFRSRTGR